MTKIPATPAPHNTKIVQDVALFLLGWQVYTTDDAFELLHALKAVDATFPGLSFKDFCLAYWLGHPSSMSLQGDERIEFLNRIRVGHVEYWEKRLSSEA